MHYGNMSSLYQIAQNDKINHFNFGSVKTGPFFMHPIYVCGCDRSLAKSKESLSGLK
uniref:Uncharacterized protein n=1 Tax=Arundo donax TaxID=35708 RepID=A0A0A9CR10_ARUDO